MIDSKYGLKYSFPHTLVHIVDNSAYAGELPVTETYDPSLFATIVVTGMPMGVDNRITTVNRSDVLNKAFGADTLTSDDIKMYGQAVEYPSSLIQQNAPVRLLRITPSNARYACAIVYIEWKESDDNRNIEVRLQRASIDDLATTAIDLSAFANTERLAKATFSRLGKTAETNNGWNREVLMTYISAGRGSAYNDYAVYINEPSFDQRKKYRNAIYNFGTIDTIRNSTLSSDFANELEAFSASFINDATKLSAYGVTSMLDTVNTQMKKRLEGSSIMIPYVNEEAVRKLYSIWKEFFKKKLNEESGIEENRRAVYNYLYKTLDVNMFDCIFGKTIYNDDVIYIPCLQIDALSTEIPLLDSDNVYIVYEPMTEQGTIYTYSIHSFESGVTEWPSSGTYYKWIGSGTSVDTHNPDEFVEIDKEHDSFEEYKSQTYTRTSSTGTVSVKGPFPDNKQLSETPEKCVNKIYEKSLTAWLQNLYNLIIMSKSYKGYDSTSVVPGTMYLYNVDTQPVFQIISSINAYTGSTSTITIPKIYDVKEETVGSGSNAHTEVSIDKTTPSKMIKKYFNYDKRSNPTTQVLIEFVNDKHATLTSGDVIAIGYTSTTNTKSSAIKKFKLIKVTGIDDNGGITTYIEYPPNYYAALDYTSHYSGEDVHDIIALASMNNNSPTLTHDPSSPGEIYTDEIKKYGIYTNNGFTTATFTASENDSNGSDPRAYGKIGALIIDDVSGTMQTSTNNSSMKITRVILNTTATPGTTDGGFVKNDVTLVTMDCFTENNFRVGTPPSQITIPSDIIGTMYDVAHVNGNAQLNVSDIKYLKEHASDDKIIYRYQITGTALSAFKLAFTNLDIPNNYYSSTYGITPVSEEGGIAIEGGYSGFFDDYKNGLISSIEYKLKYSELLVKAFKGEIDSRILSPVRVPAKFMFDAGYNCVLGIKSLPYSEPSVEDVILASTIFTDDEKEEYVYNDSFIKTRIQYSSVDVKQAMYDLMIERCYQRIPEDKRPVGPGSGFQLYLDTGFSDNIGTIKRIVETFRKKFTNPNASLDIGGYTSALNGVTYTYTKRIVDNLFRHCQQYTINKPFANTYAVIPNAEIIEFFPNIDTTDWELEQLMYTSGGNSWVLDINGNLRRKSQKTLYNESTGTSDLLQESNMRTLSQLIYLLQNQLDNWLLEYVDDGILTSMTESINNIFSGWVGTRVEALDIHFEKDINTDGGEIVICYVNVVFRGLLLRVPIIVNINRRES